MNVLVTGGTGVLGRSVVTKLRSQGHRARILTRNPKGHVDAVQGDLATGAGLVKAVSSVDAIIHAASATTQLTKAKSIDVVGTRRLLAMAREAGVSHVVYVSIVGMEGVGYPYYKAKLAAEAVVEENILPWSILRATQFHTLMETFLQAFSKPPLVAAVPFKWQFQPVDPGEVAARLVQAVTDKPAGRLPDFGGPEVRDFKSIAQSWLKARKLSKRLILLPLPFKFSHQLASGCLLAPDHKDGKITFEQYLEEKYPHMTRLVDRYGRTGAAAITSAIWALPMAAWAGSSDLSPIDQTAYPKVALAIGLVMLIAWFGLLVWIAKTPVAPRHRRLDLTQMSQSEKRWTLALIVFGAGLIAWLNAAATVDWSPLGPALASGKLGPILFAAALAIFLAAMLAGIAVSWRKSQHAFVERTSAGRHSA